MWIHNESRGANPDFSSSQLRRHTPAHSATQFTSGLCQKSEALGKLEGVGNAGCPLHPQPRAENKKHTS